MPRFLSRIRLPLSDSLGPIAFSQDSPENTYIMTYDFSEAPLPGLIGLFWQAWREKGFVAEKIWCVSSY